MLMGFLALATVPAATTAVSPDRSPQPMPVALAQPPIAVGSARLPLWSPRLSEAALLLLVGTGLLGLGAIVRRTS